MGETLHLICTNSVASLDVRDVSTGLKHCPIFFMMGGCPNKMCGMQVMMFVADDKGQVDFWWVKPQKSKPSILERETLKLHSQGRHKNTPGMSKPFYQPLADLFQQGSTIGDCRFGIEVVGTGSGISTWRAFIETVKKEPAEKLHIHFLWQEDWSSNPFARSKYIRGKILYQKDLKSTVFYSRQYEIHDGKAIIANYEEPSTKSVIPGNDLKGLWDLGTE